MNTLLDTLWYFCYITVELVVLFIVITAIVEIILMYIPQEKSARRLKRLDFRQRDCCGFRSANTILRLFHPAHDGRILKCWRTIGATMSFLIASPLLNPIIIAMLGALVGIKAMLIYVAIAFLCAVFFGWGLQKVDAQKYVKNVRLKSSPVVQRTKVRLTGNNFRGVRKLHWHFEPVGIHFVLLYGI